MTVIILIYLEAFVQRKKTTFNCAGVSFLIKLQALGFRPTTSLKKDSGVGVFL